MIGERCIGSCTHLLCARSITRQYRPHEGAGASGIAGISLAIDRGDRLAIVGRSGAGKSTFARCLALLERPDRGDVWVDGRNAWTTANLAPLRRRVQLVLQDSEAAFNPRFTAVDAVEEALRYGTGAGASARRARARELLDVMQLPAFAANHLARALSGGERRRVLLARALATEPAILILDETFTSLDAELAARINRVLAGLQAEAGFAIVLISHDLSAARRCNRAVIIDGGEIAECGPAADVFDHPSSVAGHAFAAAARRLEAASC